MNEQRTKVFLDRYAAKDEVGIPLEDSPEQMWKRVAYAIGETSDERDEFLEILSDFKFVPGGRILAGAGVESEVTFYNCYVIPIETKARRENRKPAIDLSFENPVEHREFRIPPLRDDPGSDSREAIFDTIGLMVDIMSRGGGVGINWSTLRPKGAYLTRVNGTSSGPVGWMDVASKAVGEVEQGGSRRGAAMFMLNDWHPDVVEFINAKRDYTRITNANVSVAVSDAFMDAVKSDGIWEFVFPDTTDPQYNDEWDGNLTRWKERGGRVNVHGNIRARELWRVLAESAWQSGEPGVVFLERYNTLSTARGVEDIISVNPCGEQGLGAYSVCNLGSMNLAAYTRHGEFDWDAFRDDIGVAVIFLDRVIDKNFYFIPENEQAQKDLRRIGLGVMGLADSLVLQGIRYGSPEAVAFTEGVFKTMKEEAIATSAIMADVYGPAPAWRPEMAERPYIKSYIDENVEAGFEGDLATNGLRNLFLLTQAPTGTTSILAGVNSGIEPFFALGYWREDRTGRHWVEPEAITEVMPEGTSRPDYVVTAQDVTVEEHIAMQAAVQKYVDSSVSKTINGPNSHTVEDVEKAYTLAYESGLKGLAYFRDGSGRAQVLSTEKAEEQQQPKEYTRPSILTGKTMKVGTNAGTAYVTVNFDEEGSAREVFFNVGKAGSDVMELGEAMGRLASLALRKGATLGGVANQLEGIGGYSAFNRPLASALGSALSTLNKDYIIESAPLTLKQAAALPEPVLVKKSFVSEPDLCPECGSVALVREEGCAKCHACGFSQC